VRIYCITINVRNVLEIENLINMELQIGVKLVHTRQSHLEARGLVSLS